MSSSVIAVNALTKRYAARTGTVSALEEISFSVGEGEFVAVVGPSGCGKSTLLKILAGILPSTAGEARLRGTAIAGPALSLLRCGKCGDGTATKAARGV